MVDVTAGVSSMVPAPAHSLVSQGPRDGRQRPVARLAYRPWAEVMTTEPLVIPHDQSARDVARLLDFYRVSGGLPVVDQEGMWSAS